MTASDSEDQDGKCKLKVETKVNVELHNENKVNHCGDTPHDKENDAQNKDGKIISNQNNQQPELRKGKTDPYINVFFKAMCFLLLC